MDPLSALGLAAAVVQFVDFGSRLLLDTREIYKEINGQPTDTNALAVVSSDISTLMSDVELQFPTSGPEPQSQSEGVFLRLCHECNEISQEISRALDEMQKLVDSRKRRGEEWAKKHSSMPSRIFETGLDATISFNTALKRVWNSGKISAMKVRLSEVREQIMTAALLLILDASHRSQGNMTIFSQQQDQILENLQCLVDSTRTMKNEGMTLTTSRLDESRPLIEERIKAAWKAKDEADFQVPGLSDQPILDFERNSVNKTIIESLRFETISSREEAIPLAHQQTFQWIFNKPPRDEGGEALWSDFVEWLEGQSPDTYWVTGKPGAGKSTLLRFIVRQERLHHHLSKWATETPLLVASFYSWNSGTKLQRSQEGMLRTILQQYLSQKPDLICTILPRRFRLCHSFSLLGTSIQLPDWNIPELLESIHMMIELSGSSFKLALFIDGLDEFEGDHNNLVQLVQTINASASIKMCVSSRPWNVFKDAFDDSPHLKLENITRKDMERFVSDNFSANRGFRELEVGYPQQAQKLCRDIVEKATGVFLWVDLVVKTLLKQMTEGSSFSELQALLDDLPDDLSRLYERIWNRIEPRFRSDASELIQILEAVKRKDHWLSLQLVWLCHPDCTPANTKLESLPEVALEASLKHTTRRLKSRAKDLLEVSESHGSLASSNVDYLHRTARDWILEERNWQRILDDSPFDCDIAKVLFKALSIELLPGSFPFNGVDSPLVHTMSVLLGCAFETKSPDDTMLFECLDKVEALMINSSKPCWLSPVMAKEQHMKCFATFCACMPLTAYVKHKVRFWTRVRNPEVVSKAGFHKPHTLLASAIFGFDEFFYPSCWRPRDFWCRFDDERVELVEFLLLHGKYASSTRRFLQQELRKTDHLGYDYRKKINCLLSESGQGKNTKGGFRAWVKDKIK